MIPKDAPKPEILGRLLVVKITPKEFATGVIFKVTDKSFFVVWTHAGDQWMVTYPLSGYDAVLSTCAHV